MPLGHVSPDGQIAHAPPPVPHAPGVLPAWHALFWQQPLEHEAMSQTHAPPVHA